MSRSRRRTRVVGAGAICLLLLVYTFVGPLPAGAVRGAVIANRDWLLSNYLDPTDGRSYPVRNAYRKVLATVLVHDVAADVAQRHESPRGEGDVARLMRVLIPLKGAFLNAHEVPHYPSDWPVLLSGVGFCDQVNGAVATVLARRFPISETYNIWNPQRQGHTVGRVWSDEYRDWLYYDLFYDEVVVFRSGRAGISLLARENRELVPGRDGMRGEEYLRFLSHVGSGATMSRFRSTSGGYIVSKGITAVSQRTLRSFGPSRVGGAPTIGRSVPRTLDPAVIPVPRAAAGPAVYPRSATGVDATRAAYLEARLEHLAGSRDRAEVLYRKAAAAGLASTHPDARVLGEAASLFLARLAD